MAPLGLGLGLGLGRQGGGGGDPYGGALALEYAIPAAETTIELAIKAAAGSFDVGQEVSIDWGDGTTPTVVSASSGQSGYISHEYTTAGTYLVKVSGTMKAYQRSSPDALAGQGLLTHIRSFGKLDIKSFMFAFYKCTGLISVPKYCPKNISNMRSMFNCCSGAAFNPDVSAWDVSNVDNMLGMFNGCSGASFNGNGIKNWKLKSGVNAVNMGSFMNAAKAQTATWLDEILLAWAALIGDPTNPLPSNITIVFPTNQPYTGSVSGAALAALVAHGWTISTLVDVEA